MEITRRLEEKAMDDDCHCMPACTSLDYEAQTSQSVFQLDNLVRAYGANATSIEGLRVSSVIIYLKDMQFIASRMSELYGQTDFLANCGGLLGLFSGFSLISLIEIVYFLGIRLWLQVRGVRTHHRRADTDNAAVTVT